MWIFSNTFHCQVFFRFLNTSQFELVIRLRQRHSSCSLFSEFSQNCLVLVCSTRTIFFLNRSVSVFFCFFKKQLDFSLFLHVWKHSSSFLCFQSFSTKRVLFCPRLLQRHVCFSLFLDVFEKIQFHFDFRLFQKHVRVSMCLEFQAATWIDNVYSVRRKQTEP